MQVEKIERKRAPALPRKIDWLPMTKKWWRDVWASPMAQEYLDADVHGLLRLAVLVNLYWLEPSTKLAAEIRIEQQAFGLTPLDRRRLEWQIEQVEQAQDKRDRQRVIRAVPIGEDDPRQALK